MLEPARARYTSNRSMFSMRSNIVAASGMLASKSLMRRATLQTRTRSVATNRPLVSLSPSPGEHALGDQLNDPLRLDTASHNELSQRQYGF
jgi:hypothetical protein